MTAPIEIDLEQGTDEWLEWRSSGLGSSDVPAVLGISKYKKPFGLFEIKTKRKPDNFKSNPAVERGKALEPVARQKFCAWYNLTFDTDETFEPACLEMAEFSYMKTSLDGRSNDKTINLEIKYQGEKAHEKLKQGVADPAYYAQVMHQMIVSGARKAYLCSINDREEITALEIPFDEVLAADIAFRCAEFWSHVEFDTWPTEAPSEDVNPGHAVDLEGYKTLKLKRNDSEPAELFETWDRLADAIKILENRKKEIQEKIFASGIDVCGNYRVHSVTRKGNVKYGDIPELERVDLEKYRGPETTYKQIKKV